MMMMRLHGFKSFYDTTERHGILGWVLPWFIWYDHYPNISFLLGHPTIAENAKHILRVCVKSFLHCTGRHAAPVKRLKPKFALQVGLQPTILSDFECEHYHRYIWEMINFKWMCCAIVLVSNLFQTWTVGQLPSLRQPSSLDRKPLWTKTLAPDVLQLQRTAECFEMIEQDPRLSYRLPPRNCLAGRAMRHCFETVRSVIEKNKPLIFKVGYTHCAHTRFYNPKFGYIRERDRWQHMLVVYAASETISPAFVESALIQHFKGH